MRDLSKKLKQYSIEVDFIEEDFEDEIELVLIPLRKELQKDENYLDLIIEDDKKLVSKYKNLNLEVKKIIQPIYELALLNINSHQKVA